MLPMMLVISIVLGIAPLFGIVWTITTGTIKTQDGLFMSLILLTLSGIFMLNAFWELRDRGDLAFLNRKKPTAPATPAAAAAPKTASTGSEPKAKATEG